MVSVLVPSQPLYTLPPPQPLSTSRDHQNKQHLLSLFLRDHQAVPALEVQGIILLTVGLKGVNAKMATTQN